MLEPRYPFLGLAAPGTLTPVTSRLLWNESRERVALSRFLTEKTGYDDYPPFTQENRNGHADCGQHRWLCFYRNTQ